MRPLMLHGHERAITQIKYNREGDLLFSCSKDPTPNVWFSINGERLGTFDGHNGAVWCIDVNWDSTKVATGAADAKAGLWDLETGKCLTMIDTDTSVVDHYENPRNVGSLDKSDKTVGTGLVGAPACGDVMKLQIKVDEEGKIIDAKFKTFGCGAAIASSSLATEWVKGKYVDDALKIKNSDIAKELCLPPVKLHCSMLAEDAIKAALKDYKIKQSDKSS
ncbi:unnamed protein product [Larinioides sclopetarius]|uniref:Iron-sulfur cluster assembly enzyme ISCU n=1 Tax=Larinioides sclopetarius TaxID=280406 RepID=A0AAV2AJT6_9ARAC